MAVGLGLVLLVLGLVLVLDVVNFNLSFVDDTALGWILLIVGIVALVVSLIVNQQRSRSKTVIEHRGDVPPSR